jgi:hypothetical protein
MHPREPLTKKARAAIDKYASIKAEKLPYHHFMVGFVLEAERQPRERLYAYLEGRGYRWLAKHGFWEKRNGKES